MIPAKRSTLKSRSQVNLERIFIFFNSKQSWNGISVMAGYDESGGELIEKKR